MSRSGDSVRPSRSDNSVEVGGGLGDRAGRHERDVGVRNLGSCTTVDDAVPRCPVAQDDAPEADAIWIGRQRQRWERSRGQHLAEHFLAPQPSDAWKAGDSSPEVSHRPY